MNQVAPVAAPERDRLRSGVLVVVVVATVGIVVELATRRHWHGGIQLIPWFAAGHLLVATALVGRGAPGGVRVGRVLAAVVSLASLFGVWEHVEGNYDSGLLDFRYATSWASMSDASRWWKAVSGGVGATPPIVPGALALVAALAVVATFDRGERTVDRTGDRVSGPGSRPSPP